MRFVAYSLTLLLLALAGWLGHGLWQQWHAVPAPLPPLQAALSQTPTGGPRPPLPAAAWPPIFGTKEPQPPSQPQPPAPPLGNLGFSLKGVVQNGDNTWAIISHPTGDKMLKVGDNLTSDLTVAEIGTDGLWLTGGSGKQLLEFEPHQ